MNCGYKLHDDFLKYILKLEANRDHGYRLHGYFRRVYWILNLTVDRGYKLHGDFLKYILKFEDDRGLWLQATRRFFEAYTEI